MLRSSCVRATQEYRARLQKSTSLHLLPLLENDDRERPALEKLGEHGTARKAFVTRGGTSWQATTHVFPSAFPRSHSFATAGPGPRQPDVDVNLLNCDKEYEGKARQRDRNWGQMQLDMLGIDGLLPQESAEDAQREALLLSRQGQRTLWSAIHRLRPQTQLSFHKGEPITLFLAHAHGFHKEIWEPALRQLIETSEKDGRFSIAEVWSLDTFNAGQSALLNAGRLSTSHAWFDHARDIQQFLIHYMPEEGAAIDTVLSKRPSPPTRPSKLFAIGHSHSGACLMMLPYGAQLLLGGLILLDPTATASDDLSSHPAPQDVGLAVGALSRRDVFQSRGTVQEYMSKRDYFAAWDEEVRKLHAHFGFRALADQEGVTSDQQAVTLNLSKWSEASTFAHQLQGAWSMVQLEYTLRKPGRGPFVHCIFAEGKNQHLPMLAGARSQIQEWSSHTPLRLSVEEVKANHLFVLENPVLTGRLLAQRLVEKLR